MPLKLSKILLPLDLENDPPEALEIALDFATKNSGEIVLAHVVPPGELDLHRSVYQPEKAGGANPDWAKKVAGEVLEAYAKEKIGDKVRTSTLVRQGDPGAVLVELCASEGIDLLVIAKRRSRSRLREWLLGSTAYTVVRNSISSVFVVHI